MTKQGLLVAGVDVGGTNIEVGLVGDGHEVRGRAKTDTPAEGPEAVMDAIAELVGSLEETPSAIGVGIPGVVHDGQVLTVPNLGGWTSDVDLVGGLRERLDGVPVALGNDADVGLLGEWLAGAARGCADVLGLWMGTGIGGALVVGGRPANGSRGAAGELGHVVVQPGGALCGCGRRGCVEAYAGRRSMARVVGAMVEAGRTTTLHQIRDEEGKDALTSKVWARALDDGDELATELFDDAVAKLGVALGSACNLLDVERVVVGGGMAEKLGQDLADRLREASAPWLLQPNPDLAFVVSELGDDAGVVGAASLAQAVLLTS